VNQHRGGDVTQIAIQHAVRLWGEITLLDPLEDQDPRQVGAYQLRARIGAGGMGRVYLAYTPAGRPLAIKIVRPELAEDAEFRQRFRQEVNAARRVRGAFTADVVDAEVDAVVPWLATVYVPGLSLQQAVVGHGPLPMYTVWRLLAATAEALQAIHAAGVIHRDLKPANVLLAADGPRIIDFGIARATDSTPVTRTGVRVGSPQFMAPEHAMGKHLTESADVFACGALVVFAATGRTPFGEGPDAAVLYRVVNEQPQLEGIDDPRLRDLADRCLHKDPGQRPSTAEIIQECATADESTLLKIPVDWLPEPIVREADLRRAAVSPSSEPVGNGKTPTSNHGAMPRRMVILPILIVAVLVSALILRNAGSPTSLSAPPPGAHTTTVLAPHATDTTSSGTPASAAPRVPPAVGPTRDTSPPTRPSGGTGSGGRLPTGASPAPTRAAGGAFAPAITAGQVRMSFEDGTDNWGPYWHPDQVSVSATSTVAQDGTRSLLVQATPVAGQNTAVGTTHVSGLHAGMTVTIQMWYGGQGHGLISPFVQSNGITLLPGAIAVPRATGWTSLSFTVPANTTPTGLGVQLDVNDGINLTIAIDTIKW